MWWSFRTVIRTTSIFPLSIGSRATARSCARTIPCLLYALRALGFEHVTPMDSHGAMPSPHAELFPTRSENTAVRECGMVIRDDRAVF